LTPKKSQIKKGHSMGSSTALVEIELWDGKAEHVVATGATVKPETTQKEVTEKESVPAE
jgi:hypothetical protein